jgi:RNA polymerase sigma-70 factor, ECF subfamily
MGLFAVPKPDKDLEAPRPAPLQEHSGIRDVKSLAEEANRLRSVLHGIALRRLRNPSDAEDVVQDVLVELVRTGFGSYDPDRPLLPFLVVCVRHRCFRFIKGQRFGDAENEVADNRSSGQPDYTLLSEERRSVVQAALDRLPEVERQCTVLFDLQEMSEEEVARTLGMKECAVRVARFRARQKMARWIGRKV